MYIPVAFCKLKSMFAINTHSYCVASIFTDAQIPIPTTGLDRIHCEACLICNHTHILTPLLVEGWFVVGRRANQTQG